ncbi:MAG: protein kinase [Trueperaceae bacterium]|nr:protein kinase [Trueperaceae bacterium]
MKNMLMIEEIVGDRYQIVSLLGRGGLGTVYLANDLEAGREVAVKALSGVPGQNQQRFRREFRVMARLEHPHIVRTYGSGVHHDVPYLVMAYLSGGSLRERFAGGAEDEADFGRRLELCLEILDALAYIHARGIIHRDIHPANIMLEDGKAFLMDFGLVKLLGDGTSSDDASDDQNLTRAGTVMGMVAYMSPEQGRGGAIDLRSDLYAFGCLLYWLLTGVPPFEGRSFADTLIKHLNDTPTPPSRRVPLLPFEIDRLVLELLHKAPERRPSSARDVAKTIRTLLPTLDGDAPSVTRADRADDNRADDNRAEPTARPSRLLRPPLIEREREWQLLNERLAELRQGEARLVLIEGGVGLGLSRLLGDIGETARAIGYVVVSVGNHEGIHLPYRAWREALETLRRTRPADFAAASEGLEPILSALLPDLSRHGRSVRAPLPSQLKLYDAVDTLLTRLAAAQPLVLLVDNVEVADEGTVGLLAYLARSQRQRPLLMVVALHPEKATAAVRKTLASFRADRLRLEPLSPAATTELLGAMLGGTLEPTLARYVAERADGNPFFAEEILATMLDAGQIERRRGIWSWRRDTTPIPRSIEEVFMVHLDRLGDRAQRTLQAASSIGRVFGFELLRDLLKADEDALLDDLDELLRAGLLVEHPGGRYRFSHRLLQETLHERLSRRRKHRYHLFLAETYRGRLDIRPHLLADHYAQTQTPELALPYALAAARDADALFASDLAEHYYRLALSLVDDVSPQGADIQLELADVLARIGRWDEAPGLYRGALGSPPQQVAALRGLGLLRRKQGDFARSERYLRKGLELSPDHADLHSDLGRTLTLAADYDAALLVLLRGLELAERATGADAYRAVARAQVNLAACEYARGEFSAASRRLGRAQGLLDYDRDPLLYAKVSNLLGLVFLRLEKLRTAQAAFEQARDIYDRTGDLERYLSVVHNLSVTLTRLGEQGRANDCKREVQRVMTLLGKDSLDTAVTSLWGESVFI